MGMIDRDRVEREFIRYTDAYDPSDVKIDLKKRHTFRVAELSDRIASSLLLSGDDKDLAWLIGMLHDIGRFEQIRRYQTFRDSISIDHGLLGLRILYDTKDGSTEEPDVPPEKRFLRRFLDSDNADELIRTAIKNHNCFRVDDSLNTRERMYCDLIRDADKLDIFRVNCITPLEEIYDVPLEQVRSMEISDDTMRDFRSGYTVCRENNHGVADSIVGHISLIFGLVYPESLTIAREQGYFEQLLDFQFTRPDSAEKFAEVCQRARAYLLTGDGQNAGDSGSGK